MNEPDRWNRWAGILLAGLASWVPTTLQAGADPVSNPSSLTPAAAPPTAPPPAPPVVRLPERALPPQVTPKGGPVLYSIGSPLDEEQLSLEYINRARSNPPAEGRWLAGLTDPDVTGAYAYFGVDTNALIAQFSTNPPVPPLSFNSSLMNAAYYHNRDMYTNVFQDHGGSDGSTISNRINAVYANASTWGENIYCYAASVLAGEAGFEVDWGDGPDGMQNPPGHRLNILYPGFREVGIDVILGSKSVTNGGTVSSVGPQLVTQDFGARFSATPFITGVVYYDLNGNGLYDLGEGIGGVRVDVTNASYYAITAKSGGYTVPVSSDGSRWVTFSFGGQALTQILATVSGGNNVKVDFVPAYQPPQVYGPTLARIGASNQYSFPPVLAATNHQWRLAQRTPLTAVEGAETGTTYVTIKSTSGYSVIASDLKNSGAYSFHLAHPTASPVAQSITLKRLLRPGPAAELRFASRLGYSSTSEVARVQVGLSNAAAWVDLGTQAGTNGSGEQAFILRTNSLAAYAGQEIQVRFLYDIGNGVYYNQTDGIVGWRLDDISFGDTEELTGLVTNNIPSGNVFTFGPPDTNNYVLRVRPQVSGRTLDFGPLFLLSGVPNTPTNRLALTRTPTNLLVCWPTNPPGFNLQVTLTVAQTNTWTNVLGAPAVLGTNYQMGIQATNPALFLRLQQ